MPFQYTDGLTFAETGVSVAQMILNILIQTQLVDAQLRVAAFAVADNKQPVIFRQLAVIASGDDLTGILQCTIHVKNQIFVFHTSSRCLWIRPMIISRAT